MLIASLVISGSASAVCAVGGCSDTLVRLVYIETSGQELERVLFKVSDDITPLNCRRTSDFIYFPATPGKNDAKIYSTLLTAMLSKIPVTIRIEEDPAAECVLIYVVMNG